MKTPKTKPEGEKKPPNPKVVYVYLGPTLVDQKKGKKTKTVQGVRLLPITEDGLMFKRLPETLPIPCVFGGEKGMGRPGTIYEYERPFDKPNSIYTNTRRYVGFLENDPRVIQWQAEHDAFFVAEALKQQEKKGKNRNLIQERLAPVKVAYNNLVGHQRTAFLAQVIAYITGRVTSEDERRATRWQDEEDD